MTFISNELPYPPTHGGTVDMWRRLCALKAAGVHLRVVCWHNADASGPPPADYIAKVREIADEVTVFQFQRGVSARLRRLAQLTALPWGVSGRSIDAAAFQTLVDQELAAGTEAIWLDGLYGGDLALRLAKSLQVALFFRSHNVEHLYTGRQLAAAKTPRDRVRWALRHANVEAFERNVIGAANAFFDISVDDLTYWRNAGFTHGYWLPTLVDPLMATALAAPQATPPAFDVGYLGNLFSPNNVHGVSWFVEQVVPLLLKRRPDIRIFIAGSKPDPRIRAVLAAQPQVVLLESPADAVAVLRNARVLVNPVFAGSGVNVKSVEMLFSSATLVSTPQGLAGLPADVVASFRVATEPAAFADEILTALLLPPASQVRDIALRQRARKHFQASRIAEILPILAQGKQHASRGVAALAVDDQAA